MIRGIEKGGGFFSVLTGGIASALVLFFLFAFSGCTDSRGKKETSKEESSVSPALAEAQGFSIVTFDGKTFTLSEKKGSPVVINFWASWCGPCIIEAPVLQRAYNEFKAKGVLFIGIAVQDTEEGARAFVKEFGYTFPNGQDSTGGIMKAYNVFGVPKTVIIDRVGRISYTHAGIISEGILHTRIKEVLEKP
jgi:thiol-disulfide isomerase/thioredoxin